MKKLIIFLCLVLLAGCRAVPQAETIEDILPMEFSFSSGAGAWSTELTLEKDGSFRGAFHDSDMGDTGTDYPSGTEYICHFSGRFDNFQKANETTWTLNLAELVTGQESGTEWIEDGVRYVAADAYGLDGGTEFLLYLPDTPVDGLPEEFMSWWPLQWEPEDVRPETLFCFGLYNTEMGYGFFG